MLVCYLMLGFTVCHDGKLPPPTQPYILRDLEKGTDRQMNVLNWHVQRYLLPVRPYNSEIRWEDFRIR